MTNKYTVTIREVREKQITINAVTDDEALDTVEYLYSAGNYVLDNDDIEDVEFIVSEDFIK